MWLAGRFALGLLLGIQTTVTAFDEPIVTVLADRLSPSTLEVHVGELVSWRASAGEIIRLELDPHPSAHEPIVRPRQVRAFFRQPGEHSYVVTLRTNGAKRLRGTVMVMPKGGPARAPFSDCSPESSVRICFEP